jgi:hypothetical protein
MKKTKTVNAPALTWKKWKGQEGAYYALLAAPYSVYIAKDMGSGTWGIALCPPVATGRQNEMLGVVNSLAEAQARCEQHAHWSAARDERDFLAAEGRRITRALKPLFR